MSLSIRCLRVNTSVNTGSQEYATKSKRRKQSKKERNSP